jgi:hypothetical protein
MSTARTVTYPKYERIITGYKKTEESVFLGVPAFWKSPNGLLSTMMQLIAAVSSILLRCGSNLSLD